MIRIDKLFITAAAALFTLAACTEGGDKNAAIEKKVERLLGEMTLEEKIGQMNQLSPWDYEDLAEKVRRGEVGSILNCTDPEQVNRIQRVAVEESRLGIPLIVARDVIHGYRTIFPIPLGQAASTRNSSREVPEWRRWRPLRTVSAGHSLR